MDRTATDKKKTLKNIINNRRSIPPIPIGVPSIELNKKENTFMPLNKIREEMLEGENAVEAVEDFERGQLLHTVEEKIPEKVKDTPVEKDNNCNKLYDTCTREELASLKELEKRLYQIRIMNKKEKKEFPKHLKYRFDLLIDLLINDNPPNSSIFDFKKEGNKNFGTQLFESYWDIVIGLGLPPMFTRFKEDKNGKIIKTERYLIDKNINQISSEETLDNDTLIDDVFLYLKKRTIQTAATGASDITVYYKAEEKINKKKDTCSFEEEKELSTKQYPVIYLCSSKFYRPKFVLCIKYQAKLRTFNK